MNRQRGFTLIEVMMAMAIFAVGFIGLASIEAVAYQSGVAAEHENEASALAQELANQLSLLPYTDSRLQDTTTANDSAYIVPGYKLNALGAAADHCGAAVSPFPTGWVTCSSTDTLPAITSSADLCDPGMGVTRYYLVWDVEDAALRRVGGVPDLPPNPDGGAPLTSDGKIIVARVLYRDEIFSTMKSASAVVINNNPAIYGL
ncbi:MAG: prepilin-type N-terminal cleavage/methylation domain-containing protein [Deltaproteobacteria bacterium]|nr:prepilin-type N-terminal cleavage/methylation domain-containing protein [Deltaproteobacteria bacterium]